MIELVSCSLLSFAVKVVSVQVYSGMPTHTLVRRSKWSSVVTRIVAIIQPTGCVSVATVISSVQVNNTTITAYDGDDYLTSLKCQNVVGRVIFTLPLV